MLDLDGGNDREEKMTVRCEIYDPKNRQHVKARECVICNRKKITSGAVAFAFGFTLPYCVSCIDKLHEAAHPPKTVKRTKMVAVTLTATHVTASRMKERVPA